MTEVVELDEILREFLAESTEALDRVENDLLRLEQKPGDREILGEIFRAVHTIKGTCGFLGLSRLESVTHTGESLLGRLRDGEIGMNPEIANALLALVDAIREMLAAIGATGMDGDQDYAGLVAALKRLREPPAPKPAARSRRKKTRSTAAGRVMERSADPPVIAEPTAKPNADPPGRAPAEPSRIGELLTREYAVDPRTVDEAIEAQRRGDPRHVGEILVEKGAVEPAVVRAALDTQARRAAAGFAAADNAIRVDVQLLDRLMNLVGELVLTRNRIQQLVAGRRDAALEQAVQTLNLVTTKLQQETMKTRMQPIDTICNKFPRVVRDLARASEKKIRLVMEGKDTELDRSLLEAVKDPLMHIIRNAVDHGVEMPRDRVARGKPEEGVLSLTAHHEGGRVVIEVRDDGAGIDIERVRAKAVAQDLVSEDEAAAMGRREWSELLFMPGFSTAQEVTNISGRGVGMDVVKTNVEKIGGAVEMDSEPGAGTVVRIHLPLTLAIVPAVTVVCAGCTFAIPQASIAELIRIDAGNPAIEYLHGAPVYRLRGKLLPLADMNALLALGGASEVEAQRRRLVVIQSASGTFGLLVDEVVAAQEIVVKPLSKLLSGMPEFAGCTIMGDGRVVLIVDVVGLAQRAGLAATPGSAVPAEPRDEPSGGRFETGARRWLVVEITGGGWIAFPLADVVRLERIPRSEIEDTGGRMMVQYRDFILPLHDVVDLLGERGARPRTEPADGASVPVVVYGAGARQVGLVVERIVDIVAANVECSGPAMRRGVRGTAVLKGRVTELIDVDYLSKTMEH